MKSHHFTTGFACLLISLLSPLTVVAEDAVNQQKKLQKLKGEITQLTSNIELDKKNRQALVRELARQEREIGRLGRFIHRLQQKIVGLDEELNDLARQKSQQQRSLEFHKSKLKAMVLSAYATGRQERLKLFLNQQDPVLMNRVLTYYDYFNRERIRHIDTGNALIKEIQQTESLIAEKKQVLDESYLEKNRQLDSMQQAKQQRAQLVARLEADIRDKSSTLQQLQDDAQALQQLLTELQQQEMLKQQNRQKQFATLKGRLPWPVSGHLRKLFGSPKVGGVTWDGVFISSPEGREIRAIHHGRVAYADWLRGYGLLLIIDHGDGFMSLYGHNQSLFKEAGDWIDADEPIALTGNSGGQKNAGLYFSIRKNGKPTNPKKWCKKPRGRKI